MHLSALHVALIFSSSAKWDAYIILQGRAHKINGDQQGNGRPEQRYKPT
jgi:hypothetical protein